MDTYKTELDHLSEYLQLRIDLISQNPEKWLGSSKYQIFSFEYYLNNCIKDKGGAYDFSTRRFKAPDRVLKNKSTVSGTRVSKDTLNITVSSSYSIWMGTMFNFKETVIIKQKPHRDW